MTVFSLSIGFLVEGHIASAFWAEALLPLWIVLAKVQGLYDRDHRTLRHLTADEVPSILLWVVTGTAATMLIVPALSGEAPLLGQMVGPFLIAFAAAVCFRCVARFAWRRAVPPDRTLIIGEGAPATAAQRKLELFRDIHAQPVATLSLTSGDDVHSRRDELTALRLDRILLAASGLRGRSDHGPDRLLPGSARQAERRAAGPRAARRGRASSCMSPSCRCSSTTRRTSRARRCSSSDCSTSASRRSCSFSLLPLAAFVALAILLEDGRPVLFAQTRAGFGGRPFTMWKFRTMVRDAEAMLADLVPFDKLEEPVFKLRDDPRVTRVGK